MSPQNTSENRDENGRFKPGISGNPGGRPTNAVSLAAQIREHVRNNPESVKQIVGELFTAAAVRHDRPFQQL